MFKMFLMILSGLLRRMFHIRMGWRAHLYTVPIKKTKIIKNKKRKCDCFASLAMTV